MKKIRHLIFIFIAIIFSITLNSCRSISVETYTLKTPLLEKQSSIRIVLIADLHNSIYGKDQSILIDKVKNANPDLIILAGDIIDNMDTIIGAQLLLSGISGIAPIYFVTGNHEYWTNDIEGIREELISYGVIILWDSYAIVETGKNNIILAGIEDPEKQFYEAPGYNQKEIMETVFRELDDVPWYKILIAHRPEMIETYKRYSFDLVLSGHTHGGQIRLPNIINGLYAPHQGLFPRYAGGMYSHGNITHIVSRGLSIRHPRFPRILNSPELVIVVIESD